MQQKWLREIRERLERIFKFIPGVPTSSGQDFSKKRGKIVKVCLHFSFTLQITLQFDELFVVPISCDFDINPEFVGTPGIYISENWDRTEDYFLYSCDYDRCTFYTNQDNWIKRPLYTLHYADRVTHKTFFKNKEFGGLDLVAKKPIRNCQFFALCCLKAKYKTKANLKSFLQCDVVVFDNHDDDDGNIVYRRQVGKIKRKSSLLWTLSYCNSNSEFSLTLMHSLRYIT